jgi:hypothetical protein
LSDIAKQRKVSRAQSLYCAVPRYAPNIKFEESLR